VGIPQIQSLKFATARPIDRGDSKGQQLGQRQ
jgi:hypothetical protein